VKDLSKSDKVIISLYHIEVGKKYEDKITVEDLAVKVWKLYPKDFSMRGYPQYPNVDIPKHITKLIRNNLVKGGASNYFLTTKGKQYASNLISYNNDEIEDIRKITSIPRETISEINRILNSKVFKYYKETSVPEFVEYDLFDFLGTSSRSLSSSNKNIFLMHYNMIKNDVIPFCEKQREKDDNAEKIMELWNLLNSKFNSIIKEKLNEKRS